MSSARGACSASYSTRLAPAVRYRALDSERLAPNARLSLRWADVDLAAVRANCARILDHLPKGTRLIAVVKAGGYGHGTVPVARAAVDGGATGLAVATLEEAQALGGLISAKDILVMGGLTQAQAPDASAGGWSIGVSSRELATALAVSGHKVSVHLKVDTGMGRFGSAPADAPELARFIHQSPGTVLDGTWTHFASSESDDAMTKAQFVRFTETVAALGVDPGMRHACNSMGAYNHPDFALDAVRCGIAIYGCEWPGTQPALALRSVVTHVKTVDAGDTVGYGAKWKASGKHRVATVAIGYADGVHRARSNRGDVLVRGRRAPLIGTVSMDAITLDVSDVPGVQTGDVATVIGVDGGECITAEEVGEWSGTISYEVLTSIGPRVERRYSE
jgi:alanine racemase